MWVDFQQIAIAITTEMIPHSQGQLRNQASENRSGVNCSISVESSRFGPVCNIVDLIGASGAVVVGLLTEPLRCCVRPLDHAPCCWSHVLGRILERALNRCRMIIH